MARAEAWPGGSIGGGAEGARPFRAAARSPPGLSMEEGVLRTSAAWPELVPLATQHACEPRDKVLGRGR